MMVALAILAIGLGIAVPSFNALIAGRRAATAAGSLRTDLSLARVEATRSGRHVGICPADVSTGNATACSGTDWSKGWLVFVDANNDDALNGGETVLRVRTPERGLTATAGGTLAGVSSVIAYPSGELTKSGTMTFCRTGYPGVQLAVALSGSLKTKPTQSTCP